MADPAYQFQRGEPVVFGARVTSGDIAGVAATAVLKRAASTSGPQPGVPAVATFAAAFTPAAGEAAAYWLFTIDAAASAQIPPGRYLTDVRFVAGGETIQISQPVRITINPSVTLP